MILPMFSESSLFPDFTRTSSLEFNSSIFAFISVLVLVFATIESTLSLIFLIFSKTPFSLSSVPPLAKTTKPTFLSNSSSFSIICCAFLFEFSNLSLITSRVYSTVFLTELITSAKSCAAKSVSCFISIILSARLLFSPLIKSISSSLSIAGISIFFISSGFKELCCSTIDLISCNFSVIDS